MTNKKKLDLEERTAKFDEDIIEFAKKESKESKHWLRMISKAIPQLKSEAKMLWKEANELNPVRYLRY